jgi:2-hydroxychromene-2-carboxylate isomerase
MTTLSYYFTPVSPWTYLGHERFLRIARAAQATVEVLPVDYGAIFPASGGLPLAKRAPQRQAYRLVELRRFSAHLGVPLNLQPKFFPADPTLASQLIVAVDTHDGADAALRLTTALTAAVWAQERDIADPGTLAQLLAECGLSAQRVDDANDPAVAQRYRADTQRAIDAGVFGAPSYVVDGEIFWGQDRLEFLERRLARS